MWNSIYSGKIMCSNFMLVKTKKNMIYFILKKHYMILVFEC